MAFKVMTTNGGPHSAADWAVATAEFLVDIDASVTGERLIAAKKLQAAVAEALLPHHTRVQENERAAIAAAGDDHLSTPMDSHTEAEATFEIVKNLAKGTPWEWHFERVDVRREAIETIIQHTNTSKHIERRWHAQRNRGSMKVEAWLAQHNAN